MGNYDDWDSEWQPVGDPVPTDDDSNDYSPTDYGVTEDSGPTEPSLSDTGDADLGASEPTLGEAWAALRQQYAAAGLGAGGVVTEPESPDQVIRRWHDRLELPDEYGPTEQGPDESSADQPYPDESERAQHRPAYVGPPLPEASPPNEWEISYPIGPSAAVLSTPKSWASLPQDITEAWGAFLQFAGLSPNAPPPKPTPALPPNWDQMTPGEKLQWGMENREHAPTIPELAEGGLSNIARANEYIAERTPGVGGAEKLALQDVPNALGVFPRTMGGLMAWEEQMKKDYPAQADYYLKLAQQLPVTEEEKQAALAEQNERGLPQGTLQQFLEKFGSEGVETYRQQMPLPFQIAADFVDPGNVALGKVLELPKVASQAGKWEVIKAALESQGLESHVPVVEQMIKDAGGWGSKGASRVLKEAEELFVGPATAAKVGDAGDRVLRVLNENKGEGVQLFTRENLAQRREEAQAILDDYMSKAGPTFKRWNGLPQSVRDDIGKQSLIDAATGLESRYAYGLETKPKGWLHAITDVNGLGAINKKLGEAMGNEVIADLGGIVEARVKEAGGRAFRFGGDEIKMWFPDEESAQKTLAAIDKEFREHIIEWKVPDGPVVRKKGFTISYGYGRDELAADNALNADKLRRQGIGERAGKGILPGGISDAGDRVGPPGGNQLRDAGRPLQDTLEARGAGTQAARVGQIARSGAAVPLYERWDTLPLSQKKEIGRGSLLDAATGLESKFAYEHESRPQGWVEGVAGMNGLAGINEAFGHPAADDLLDAVGKVVKAKTEEEGGRAFRFGGDAIKLWFPDEGSARRAMAAIDQEVKERVLPVTLRDGTVAWKKGFSISYGYGPEEAAAAKAFSADKLRREAIGERAPRGVVPPSIVDVPFHGGTASERDAAALAASARAGLIGTVARAARRSDESPPQADTPRIALEYMRRQLSNLGYSSAKIDQLRMGDAAQIIAEGRTPQSSGAEGPSGQGSARGSAPGGIGSGRVDAADLLNRSSGRGRSGPQVPLSISQQMARLYRGTLAGDDYWSQKRPAEHDGWAMVPDDLKRALEEYWRGENLTRHEVQRLMPVYRRYVAQTDYPGDMVHWITATLPQERSPSGRAGGRAHASR